MVAVMMRPGPNNQFMLNIVRTIEMRSDTDKLITPETMLYIDANKKRVRDWFHRLGNKSVPFAVNQYGLIRRINYSDGSVNTDVQYSRQTEIATSNDAFHKGDKINVDSAELVILNADDGQKYLYDVVNIKKDVAVSERLNEKARSAEESAYRNSNVKSSVAQFAEDVNRKNQEQFSARESLSEEETAMAKGQQTGAEADELSDISTQFIRYSMRNSPRMTADEYKRVSSAWNDYAYRRYKFAERRNGGILVDLDSAIVYTDSNGTPEYLLDVGMDDRWSNNDVYNLVVEMEKEGKPYEVQQRILKSVFGTEGAHFRTGRKRKRSGGEERTGAGRNEGKVGFGYTEEVSEEVTNDIGSEQKSERELTVPVEASELEDMNTQFSTRDQTDAVSVREYLAEMTPKSYMNDTEVELLKRYQTKLKELQEKQRAVAEQEEIIKTANGEELMKATNRRKVLQNQADRLAKTIAGMESAKGFAGIMTTSRKVEAAAQGQRNAVYASSPLVNWFQPLYHRSGEKHNEKENRNDRVKFLHDRRQALR
ncbi:MAG: hypothetical protein ACI4ME_06770 [Aristaeellaceae bacterium]